MLTHVRFVLLLCLGAMAAPAAAAAGSWPDLLGPEPDLAQDIFDADGFGLAVSFKIPLGSAYSRIAIVGGKAVTMYSDGRSDLMVALEAATGRELWRYRIDDTHRGHDGSDDGPLSSPVIDDGIVYGVAPRGKVFGLRMADG